MFLVIVHMLCKQIRTANRLSLESMTHIARCPYLVQEFPLLQGRWLYYKSSHVSMGGLIYR